MPNANENGAKILTNGVLSLLDQKEAYLACHFRGMRKRTAEEAARNNPKIRIISGNFEKSAYSTSAMPQIIRNEISE